MTRTKFFGKLAFVITSASAIPYLWGVLSGDHHPNVTSWILWTLIGLVMLVSYKDAGANDNVWVGVVAFTNPLVITTAAVYKGNPWNNPGQFEWVAIILCGSALAVWWIGHAKNVRRWVVTALFASIVADVCAGGLTVRLAWTDPMQEQPISWGVYLVGELLFFKSITQRTLDQYALPAYGVCLAIAVLVPTVAHRVVVGIPFLSWF